MSFIGNMYPLSHILEDLVQKSVQAILPGEMESLHRQFVTKDAQLLQAEHENLDLKEKIANLERLIADQAEIIRKLKQEESSGQHATHHRSVSCIQKNVTFAGQKNGQRKKNPVRERSGHSTNVEHEIDDMKCGWFCTCGMEFSAKSNLNFHMRYYKASYKFTCDKCPTKFVYATDMRKHMRTVHQKEPEVWMKFGCRVCGKFFPNRSDLLKHRRTAHIQNSRTTLLALPPNAEATKKHGFAARERVDSMDGTMKMGRPKLKFICLCKQEYTTKAALKQHVDAEK